MSERKRCMPECSEYRRKARARVYHPCKRKQALLHKLRDEQLI